jgi:hypothetical protein
MGPRSRLTLLTTTLATLTACRTVPTPPVNPPPSPPPQEAMPVPPPAPKTMAEKVVADFETAIKTSREAYVALFDFVAVGEMEILLHRYDLLGRLDDLPDDVKAQFAGEGAVPYPAERERTNVGNFYKILGQRTVGTGGCVAGPPRTEYGQKLATFEPLPAGALVDYEPLRKKALGYVEKGGLISLRCKGGKGGIALVWTERPNARGYDLITIYDD